MQDELMALLLATNQQNQCLVERLVQDAALKMRHLPHDLYARPADAVAETTYVQHVASSLTAHWSKAAAFDTAVGLKHSKELSKRVPP